MYQAYKRFIRREWMIVNEVSTESEIREFVQRNPQLLIKPLSGEQGHGIKLLKDLDSTELILSTKKGGPVVIEAMIKSHSELHRINPASLNTYRIFTTVDQKGEVTIIGAFLRCGASGQVVDNWGSGGVCYPIDIASGIVYKPGRDKKGHEYINHPETNVQVVGLKMPLFEEACNIALDIIANKKNVCYAGLDIAATDKGIELIEVNFPGGHDILQGIDQIGKYSYLQHLYGNNY